MKKNEIQYREMLEYPNQMMKWLKSHEAHCLRLALDSAAGRKALKSILKKGKIDPNSVSQYFRHGITNSGGMSIYSAIAQLEILLKSKNENEISGLSHLGFNENGINYLLYDKKIEIKDARYYLDVIKNKMIGSLTCSYIQAILNKETKINYLDASFFVSKKVHSDLMFYTGEDFYTFIQNSVSMSIYEFKSANKAA